MNRVRSTIGFFNKTYLLLNSGAIKIFKYTLTIFQPFYYFTILTIFTIFFLICRNCMLKNIFKNKIKWFFDSYDDVTTNIYPKYRWMYIDSLVLKLVFKIYIHYTIIYDVYKFIYTIYLQTKNRSLEKR